MEEGGGGKVGAAKVFQTQVKLSRLNSLSTRMTQLDYKVGIIVKFLVLTGIITCVQ